MLNWEAVWIIGGGAVALCVILSAAAIGIRRRRLRGRASTDGVLPRAALILYGLMVLALVVGFAVLLSTRFGRLGGIGLVMYCIVLVVVTILIAKALERRGVRFTPERERTSPPNTSLERNRES